MKRLVVWIGVPIFVVTMAASGAWVWFSMENRPAEASETRVFRIPQGEPLGKTAQRLADQNLIRSPLVFRLLFQWGSGDGAFPSGTFSVPGGLSAVEAAEWFRHAQPLQVKVTVPEGWTATKIARLLEEKGIVPAAEFLAVVRSPGSLGEIAAGLSTLDGRLFPDTYLFPLATPAAEVAKTFLQTFRRKTAPWASRHSESEWSQRIILASIVEREYRVAEEAPLIASVFANRLDRNIALASCATIEYILTEVQGRPHPKRIFFVHTEIESPYNTYLHKGLPPTPICNPGLTALKSAFEPAPTDYLYFVVADAEKGTHRFSSNYAGHLKAREAYLNSFVTKG